MSRTDPYATCDVLPEYADESEYGDLIAALDDLEVAYDDSRRNRALRRSGRVATAADSLRTASAQLWQFDDGHSDFGYDGPIFNLGDDLHATAVSARGNLSDAIAALLAAIASRFKPLRRRVRRVRRDAMLIMRRQWRQAHEGRASPPKRPALSNPKVAHAPPCLSVVLRRDDVTTGIAA